MTLNVIDGAKFKYCMKASILQQIVEAFGPSLSTMWQVRRTLHFIFPLKLFIFFNPSKGQIWLNFILRLERVYSRDVNLAQ
jgi:hypothetical protein